MKKIQGLLIAAFATLALVGTTAHADTVWNFSYSGDGVSASGQFDTLGNGSTPSAVEWITGTYSDALISNGTIDGVVALNTDGGFIYNNVFGGTPQFDLDGLLFDVDHSLHVNLYTNPGYYSVVYEGGGVVNTPVSLSVTAVPEPESLALILAGLGALVIANRRKNRA
jgi:hypothetical protein